jgi:carbon storage regulator
MLVLSRRKNQVIWIGDIKVVIVDVDRDKVRIGVDAPSDLPIYRAEILTNDEAKARVSEVVQRRLADLEAANTGTPRPGC